MNLRQENNVELLRQAALLLEAENQRLVAKVVQLTKELANARGEDASVLQLKIAALEEELAKKNRWLFAPSSEQRRPPKPQSQRKAQVGHGPSPQPSLNQVEKVHLLDEADQVCSSCGGQLSVWAGQFEESEEVEVVERKFVLVKHRRQKYRCQCGGCVETALGPKKLFEGARYSVDFAIEVAVQKYLDHLPLERQVRMMKREGLDVDSQTLWDYLERLARLLESAHERLHQYILLRPVVGMDETGWLLMAAPLGERSKWQVWAVSTAKAIVYRILDSRSAEAAREVLGGYEGIVMADGYSVYQSLKKQGGKFQLVHCWAHVRREFFDIQDNYPQAQEVLDFIRDLYAIEARCPTGPPGDELRKKLRNEESRLIVAKIHSWALAQRVLPQSGLGKAISYLGGLWNGLVRFLDDPRIPFDNNATERALRGPVVGRKNHYGSRSRRGTEVAALLYSLLESAKLCGLEPKSYLRSAVAAALAQEQIPLPHEVASAV